MPLKTGPGVGQGSPLRGDLHHTTLLSFGVGEGSGLGAKDVVAL